MVSEDTIARDLRSGGLTLGEALELLAGDEVYVYDAVVLNPTTADWDDVANLASGSAELFTALRAAGATEEQLDTVGEAIERQRAAGKTIQSLWPTT